MIHTKDYMDAMWVVQNPEKYDNRDVVIANSFIENYNRGLSLALSLSAVAWQSEQLPCLYCGQLEPCAGNSPETCYHPKVC